MPEANRPLRVFLCHSSNDKPIVRDLYRRLEAEGWMDVWLDEEKLYPGQDWNFEIEKAVEDSQIVLIFLTNNSVSKEGYIQRELRLVLDVALNMPEETIFVIPLKLEDCPVPRRLQTWQWLNYFPEGERDRAYQRLLASLKIRARKLGLSTESPSEVKKRLEAEEQVRLAKEQAEHEKKAVAEREAEQARARITEENDKRTRERKPVEARTPRAKPIARQADVEKPVAQPIVVQLKPKDTEEKAKSFWTTLPGILTGIAAVLTALAGCVTAVVSLRGALSPVVTQTPPAITMTLTQTPPVINTLTPTVTHEVLGIGKTTTSPKDGMTLLYVPAGEFTMGSDNGEADEKPVHKVTLDAFWIDQTEVAMVMYATCVKDGPCKEPLNKSSSTHSSYYGNSEFDNYPVIYVDWNQANTYCLWVGRRLPTEAEWEKAARGTDQRIYPWGNTIDQTYANYNNNVGDTTKVGSYETGKTQYRITCY